MEPVLQSRKDTIAAIAEFLMAKWSLSTTARLLMWRQVMSDYFEYQNVTSVGWPQCDCAEVHWHFNKHRKGIKEFYEDLYRLKIVFVNNTVRAKLKHGDIPIVGGSRTPEWYLRCMPSSSNPAYGFAVFPEGQNTDHPLIVAQLSQRVSTTSNGLTTTSKAVSVAGARKNISEDTLRKINRKIVPVLEDVLDGIPVEHKLDEPPKLIGLA